MRMIDNVTQRLGDDLKAQIMPGSTVRVAASTFSIYAFEALREELERVEAFEFIFTSPSFVPAEATDKLRKERRQYFIPPVAPETQLAGTQFEVRLRNKLTQRAIARECARWLADKATFRANTTGRSMPPMALVGENAAYFNLGGFTSADLGYEPSDAMFTAIPKMEGADEAKQYLDTFQQVWHSGEMTDVTQSVHDHLASVYAENSPERIYFLILASVFADFLEDLNEDNLPNDRTGYQDTKIWKSLYNFQRDAAGGIINKLETYNGCILADSVGLGKTFTALAVIKYYELRNKNVLVLCPKKLAENWTNYNANLTTNELVEDRFNYNVLAHTDLSRTSGESLGMPLDRVNWGNYDLVVIDESHNFRNADYAEEKESRYQRLMRKVIREGVKTKVLMLSATPVNNRFNDLKNQLQLAYEGDSDTLAAQLPISSSIDAIFRGAQKTFNQWSELAPEARTTDAIVKMLDFDFFQLLDAVTIARSRRHIQTYYDTSDVGVFPTRLAPLSLQEPLTDIDGVPSYALIYDQLQALNLGVYTPLAYVFASQRDKYDEQFAVTAGNGRANIGQAGRERGLKQLMTVNLLKRLESSVEAFRITLKKIESSVTTTLSRLDEHANAISEVSDAVSDMDVDLDDDANVDFLAFSNKMTIDLKDVDVESWRRDLWHDAETLRELIDEMEKVTPKHDLKLQRLRRLIVDKARNPINEGNRKVLIFSAFADTANYLYRQLGEHLAAEGLETAVITGGSHGARTTLGAGYDFQKIMTLFSPVSKKRAAVMPDETRGIDVLIGTDVICEGQNLQDCDYLVNYDIHWNPVRIIQRFGRIDRIGSTNDVIQLVNFWPDISLDEYINLKERVENRMVIADVAGTADDNVLTQEGSDAAFRKEQLRKLQDEVIELEDVRTGVSITDLGLNDFRMDLFGYAKEHGDLARTPRGLHAVVSANPAHGLVPGVIFALRNVNADDTINRGNRIHPHYLVYLADDGRVITQHTDPKPLLDLLRRTCRPHAQPVADAVGVFNTATNEGVEMEHYSHLLDEAIRSMIDVTDEQDVDSLFRSGPTTALTQTISGLDDFELTAFVAVVAPTSNGHPA